jgi:hypothetical protein
VLRNAPYANTGNPLSVASFKEAAGCPDIFKNRLEKSTRPKSKPIGGIITLLTSAFTIFPNAAPIITPMARSITDPLMAKSLNSLRKDIIFD